MFEKLPTELVLSGWRYGQTQAERLAANILIIEGFESVDPQCPLGGPDGLKDILCKKDEVKWIAACYFPTTPADFSKISVKFKADLKGVKKNGARGFAFFTNQRISPAERSELVKLAKPYRAEIYHVERIRGILDDPRGYGLRLEYLRIPMSTEEQVSLWSAQRENLEDRFKQQENAIGSLHKMMDELMVRTMSIHTNLASMMPSSLARQTELEASLSAFYPTSSLTQAQLLWLHRSLCDDTAATNHGLRNVEVWIGGVGTSKASATFVPIPHTLVEVELDALLSGWRKSYPKLLGAERDAVIEEISKFHYDFLRIHPFLDGNGRIARALLRQQVKELLGKELYAVFSDDPKAYYKCLESANTGNLKPLTALIAASLE